MDDILSLSNDAFSEDCINCGALSFLWEHGRTKHSWQCEDLSNKFLTYLLINWGVSASRGEDSLLLT